MTTWLALLRKDWNVYRTAVVGAAAMTALPYAVLLPLQWYAPAPQGNTPQTYRDAALAAAGLGMVLAVLLAAAFGGLAFAAERRERSAEFLAMLPARRWHVAFSKLTLSLVCIAAVWSVHAAVTVIAEQYRPPPPVGAIRWATAVVQRATQFYPPLIVMALGAGWLLSSFMANASLAAVLGLVGCAMAFSIFVFFAEQFVTQPAVAEAWFYATTVGVGVVALVLGTLVYLRRVAP